MIEALPCGCVRLGLAVAYCKDHGPRNPPAAPRPLDAPPAKPATGKPSPFGRRRRWSPETGELEE